VFQLNKDVDTLAAQYAATGVLSVPDILQPEIAAAIRAEMELLPWETAFVQGRSPQRLNMRTMPAQQRQQILQQVVLSARQEPYQFCYDTYMLITHYLQNTNPNCLLHRFVEHLCSEPVLQFMRQITGAAHIIKADGQASCYLPGHFLKQHDDDGANFQHERIVAYTIGFSAPWQAHWGGILHLQNEAGDIEQSLMPRFNTLNIFSVPRQHFVSQVASYCPEPRLSIVGWFRSDRN
jgi:Rps23 Pro-64 3,4-dihydroxylase Tpa1-like proline 4-hydroxylase